MKIHYKLKRIGNISQNGDVCNTAVVFNKCTISTEELCKAISDQCSATHSDVEGIIRCFSDQISERISRGEIVDLGKLGRFKASLKTELSDSENRINIKNIRGIGLNYSPSAFLEADIDTATFIYEGNKEDKI